MTSLLLKVVLPTGLAASIAFGLLLLGRPVSKRLTARHRKAAVAAAMALFLLPLPFALNAIAGLLPQATGEPPATFAPAYTAGERLVNVLEPNAAPDAEPLPTDNTPNTPAPVKGNAPAAKTGWQLPALGTLLALVYLLGTVATATVLCTRYALFYRALKNNSQRVDPDGQQELLTLYKTLCDTLAVQKPPALYTSGKVASPLLVGRCNARIVLPQSLAAMPQGCEYALRHELTHHRHCDVALKTIAEIVLALHWFNPLCHLLRRELNEVCEQSCDEAVAEGLGGTQRKAYALALLQCAEMRVPYAAAGFASPAKRLQKRLGLLLHPAKKRRGAKAALCGALALLATLGLLVGCSFAAGTSTTSLPPAQLQTALQPEEIPTESELQSLPEDIRDEQPEEEYAKDDMVTIRFSDGQLAKLDAAAMEKLGIDKDTLITFRATYMGADTYRIDATIGDKDEDYIIYIAYNPDGTPNTVANEGNYYDNNTVVSYTSDGSPLYDLLIHDVISTGVVQAMAEARIAAKENREVAEVEGNFVHPVPEGTYMYRGFLASGHRGCDIKGAYGDDIVAVAAGEVIDASWHYSYGWIITVDHGGGLITRYAHCKELLADAGQSVMAGDVIAAVGNTGDSTGNHLHLEFILDDEFVNPADYIKFY